MKLRVLYISQNGLCDYIGQSQVLPYLLGLAQEGFAITVVSAEKKVDASLRDEVARQIRAAGIDWHYVRYHSKPPLVSTIFDLYRLLALSIKVVRDTEVRLIHCRSFLPEVIGLVLKRLFNIPVLFDFRDFWADRGLHGKRFKFVYRYFKRQEGWMIRNSDHVVTLTEKARAILRRAYVEDVGGASDERFTVIPTCVDVNLFDTRFVSEAQRLAIRRQLKIDAGQMVCGYLGTFHADYIPAEMFRAFRMLCSFERDAKFLFVSPTSREEITRVADMCGVRTDAIRVVSAARAEVPRYLSIFDFSLVFIRPDASTAGVFPTKLAELFACNVPVLANSGVGDMDEIVRPNINDSVLLQEFSDEALREGIRDVLRIVRSPARCGRSASMQFSLSEGVRRYATVYSRFVRPTRQSC